MQTKPLSQKIYHNMINNMREAVETRVKADIHPSMKLHVMPTGSY